MTSRTGTALAPAIVVVDAAAEDLRLVGEALRRRFGGDYRVVTFVTAVDALDALARLEGDGTPVALVAADHALPGTGGLEVLRRARALHPGAARAVFVPMADAPGMCGAMGTVLRASALGQIDFSILKGWVS